MRWAGIIHLGLLGISKDFVCRCILGPAGNVFALEFWGERRNEVKRNDYVGDKLSDLRSRSSNPTLKISSPRQPRLKLEFTDNSVQPLGVSSLLVYVECKQQ